MNTGVNTQETVPTIMCASRGCGSALRERVCTCCCLCFESVCPRCVTGAALVLPCLYADRGSGQALLSHISWPCTFRHAFMTGTGGCARVPLHSVPLLIGWMCDLTLLKHRPACMDLCSCVSGLALN